jgi:hypothetical protein
VAGCFYLGELNFMVLFVFGNSIVVYDFWVFALPPSYTPLPSLALSPWNPAEPKSKTQAASCQCHGYRQLVASAFFLLDPVVYSASAQPNSWRCAYTSHARAAWAYCSGLADASKARPQIKTLVL